MSEFPDVSGRMNPRAARINQMVFGDGGFALSGFQPCCDIVRANMGVPIN